MAESVVTIAERNLIAAHGDRYRILIPDTLMQLPEDSTLYVDLSSVEYMSPEFAFAGLGLTVIGLRGGLLANRHLVLYNPSDDVLETVTTALDSLDQAFVLVRRDGTMQIRGRALIPSLRRVLVEVARSAEPQTASSLSGPCQCTMQATSDMLKRLHQWGLLVRVAAAAKKRGRPTSKYTGFWPPNTPDLPELSVHELEIATVSSDPKPIVIKNPHDRSLRIA